MRGTYLCTQSCLPHLIKSAWSGRDPHVLNMSPPLSMREHWFKNHVAYTMAKYGMSECTLGHAGEFRPYGHRRQQPLAAHCDRDGRVADDPRRGRRPLPPAGDPRRRGLVHPYQRREDDDRNFFIDDEVLVRHGVNDLEKYSVTPGTKDFIPDFFVD